MKYLYIRPCIRVEEMNMESPLLVDSPNKEVVRVDGNSGLGYKGAGTSTNGGSVARTAGTSFWDEDDDTGWDQL